MAGTMTYSRTDLRDRTHKMIGEKLTVTAVADASDGSFPNLTISKMVGLLVKVVTNPGSPAPTDNYDIYLYDGTVTDVDVLGGALANRDTSNSEAVDGTMASGTQRVFLDGDHVLAIANNSTNSAQLTIVFTILFWD